MGLNYRDIDMNIVHARQIARDAVFSDDKTTYLYTRWTFDVDCVWNPADVAWAGGGPAFGSSPTVTDREIRHRLLQPRGTLIFTVGTGAGAETLLRCPTPPYTIDLENGPVVESCTVQQIHGTKTFAISIRIRCAVNECTYNTQVPVLLSHRWRRYCDIDQDYFTTITTEGEAIFRVDELVRLGRFPAEYRTDLMHAPPHNFKRESTMVDPSPDGTRVRYRTVDRELAYTLGPANPATRIECYVTNGHGSPSGITALAEGVADLFGALPGMVSSLASGGFSAGAGSAGGTATGMISSGIRRLTPSWHQHILCRAWGHKNSRKRDLMAMGMAVVLRHMLTFMRNSEIVVTFDVAGRFVEISMNRKTGLEAFTAPDRLLATLLTNSQAILSAGFPAGDFSLLGELGGGVGFVVTGFRGVNAADGTDATDPLTGTTIHLAMPTPGRLGYGTFVGRLMHEALSNPCTVPVAPADPNLADRQFFLY